MVKYTVENVVKSPELEDARFVGKIEELLQKVIYERMTSEKAQTKIFKEAEAALINRIDDSNAPLGLWQGEFWGKLIIGACRCCRYTGDIKLKNFIAESVKRVIDSQDNDGYIGSYKNKEQVYRALYNQGREKVGWDCDWTWNIWCRKYTLWGLLEAYELLREDYILDAAVRFTNQLIEMLDEIGAKICETGTFFGLPSGSILKPILILYRHTNEKKYLDFALEIAKEWEDDEVCCSKIIKNSLADKPIHLWNDNINEIKPMSKKNPFQSDDGEEHDTVRSETSHKAYEMMSCFDGLLELYRVTGVNKYLDATEHFFSLLIKYEYNTLFSVGFNDLFINASKYQNSITELCDVIHFMRLSTELFKLTGNSEYIDYAELAFYNPFLAGVTRDGVWGARGVRPSESHMFEGGQAGLKYNHCCVNNMPRGFMNIAEMTAMYNNDNIYINFYHESHVVLHPSSEERIDICIGGDYLKRCEAVIDIDSKILKVKSLMLRVPSWSKQTRIIFGNNEKSADCSGYVKIPLGEGRQTVKIYFDNRPRLKMGNYNYNFYPMTPYMEERYLNFEEINYNKMHSETIITQNKATLCVGPVLLAVTDDLEKCKGLNILPKSMIKTIPIENERCMCSYNVYFTDIDKKEFCIRMCDFASASNTMEFKDFRYSVFL